MAARVGMGSLRAVETATQDILSRPALRLQHGSWLNCNLCIWHHHKSLMSRWPGISVPNTDPGMWLAALDGAPACA